MSRFEITEKTSYSSAWILLFVLFLAGIVVWLTGWPRVALGIAVVGLVAAALSRLRGKKKVGNHLELNDKGIIFWDPAETRCIAFNEIKSVKYSRFMGIGEETFLIETTVGTKKTVKPQEYENCDQLRERLRKSFNEFNCNIVE
ncbi:MAG TPA: hypothetical protein VN426_02290 [Syntrophomonadaceae bacterium]|nr:hypothetical protein [Syntrophomonadaceae bacterium]